MAKDLSELLTIGGADTPVDRSPKDPYSTWAEDPTPENMKSVIDDLSPVINAEIQRFSGPKPLLRGKARAMAINAVKTYNPASGAKLRSWVVTQLQQLSRYNNSLKPVYVPEDAARKGYLISQKEREFIDAHGRNPTDTELADSVGVSTARLRKIRSQMSAMVNENQIDADTGDDDQAPEYAIYSSNSVQAAQDAVYSSLDKNDRLIFDMKTGLHGQRERSGQEIAKRLGVSAAYVSQRSAQIANQIRRVSQFGGL